jgi:endonuclease YncB( thermonuclease family)
MGMLEVTGTIKVSQFWPEGVSDADTTKVIVRVDAGAFRFNGKTTRVFDGATVKRAVGAKSGKPAISKKSEITIRLQGIDAPELHYRPTVPHLFPPQRIALRKVNAEFRQPLGETAAAALGDFLQHSSPVEIPCVVRTNVKKPSDVFDIYGRFVGDIYVVFAGTEIDLNHWVIEQGWAFPAFYVSMTKQEVADIIGLARKAMTARRGVWARPARDIRVFDPKLVFRGKGVSPEPKKDKGVVTFPKLFRRVATWSVLKQAKIIQDTFVDYLKASADECWTTSTFLALGATPRSRRFLHDFISSKGDFTSTPEGLVFAEEPSVLVDAKGREIVHW